MKISACKDCPARYPTCHDHCESYAAWKKERDAETTYTRQMLDSGTVYHYDSEDKHRNRGRKKYMGANGGADR